MTTVFDMHVNEFGIVYTPDTAVLFLMNEYVRFFVDDLSRQVNSLQYISEEVDRFNLKIRPIGRVLDDWELEPRLIQKVDYHRHIMPLRSKYLLIE